MQSSGTWLTRVARGKMSFEGVHELAHRKVGNKLSCIQACEKHSICRWIASFDGRSSRTIHELWYTAYHWNNKICWFSSSTFVVIDCNIDYNVTGIGSCSREIINSPVYLNLFQLSRIYNCMIIASCSIHGPFIHNFKIILCISWQYKGLGNIMV